MSAILQNNDLSRDNTTKIPQRYSMSFETVYNFVYNSF